MIFTPMKLLKIEDLGVSFKIKLATIKDQEDIIASKEENDKSIAYYLADKVFDENGKLVFKNEDELKASLTNNIVTEIWNAHLGIDAKKA
jgi:hypothetical protein